VISNPDSVRPLVLLDVDGVINDAASIGGTPRPWMEHRLAIGGTPVRIPLHVPPLIQHFDLFADIVWCTTWMQSANQLVDVLGAGPFPAIVPESDVVDCHWKARAARPHAQLALDAGRRVLWIEDFAWAFPTDLMPADTEYIDTAALGEYVLLPEHLPPDLLPAAYR